MNGPIEAAFFGRLGQDPELKTSAAGKPWARLHLALGQDPDTQWVSVAVFGDLADRLCAKLRKGDKVYVEGTLRLSEWTGRDGEKRAGLSVAAWKAEKLGAIGRNKPRRATKGSEGADVPRSEMDVLTHLWRAREIKTFNRRSPPSRDIGPKCLVIRPSWSKPYPMEINMTSRSSPWISSRLFMSNRSSGFGKKESTAERRFS